MCLPNNLVQSELEGHLGIIKAPDALIARYHVFDFLIVVSYYEH